MWKKNFLKKVAILFMVSMVFGGSLLATEINESIKIGAKKAISEVLTNEYQSGVDLYFNKSLDNLSKEVSNASKVLSDKNKNLTIQINKLAENTSGRKGLQLQLEKVKQAQTQVNTWNAEYYEIRKTKATKVNIKKFFKKIPVVDIIFEAYSEGYENGSLENFEKDHPSIKVLTNEIDTTTEIVDFVNNIVIGTISFGVIDKISFDLNDDISMCDTEERLLSWLDIMANHVTELKKNNIDLNGYLPTGVKQYLELTGEVIDEKINSESFYFVDFNVHQSKEDPNKEKLAQLEKKEGKLHSEIKDINKKVDEPKEPTTSLEDKKLKAVSLLSENKKRAQEYEVLYLQLKKDPNNKVLQQRVVDADQLLRDSTVNYISARNEIRKTDSQYGSSAYSRDAIRDRINNNYSQIFTPVNVDDKKIIALSGMEKKEPELISYTITNPESQIDANKEKLAQLEAKEKELKSKIKDANTTDDSIKEKKNELAIIQSQISELGAKLRELEKGTDEYSYVLKDWANLAKQKKSILNEIDELTGQLENQKNQINVFQFESNLIIQSLKDTSDYNNDTKINLTQNVEQPTVVTPSPIAYNDWQGYMTSNVRINGTAGELRYWGGNFDDDLNDHPGGFTLETNSKTGNVENVQINDGPSYDISYNEIQKTDYSYNPNPKNVRIWKVNSNSNNIVVEASGSYNYTSWGTWQQDGGVYTDNNLGHGIEHNIEGHWVAGDVTVDLPKMGSATYNGTVAGSWYTAGDLGNDANRPQYGGAIKGTMAMTVDFSNASIVAGNLNLKKADNSSFATATMNNMQINTTNNAFQGKLIGTNIVDNGQSGNVVKGRFYGPKAEEVGGNWNVNKTTGEFASGVFAGKK